VLLSVLAYTAFGIFASSVTENQIISAFLSFAGLLFFYLLGDVTSSQEGWRGAVAAALSIRQHTLSFAKGVIELKDIFYFCAFTFFFLFLSLEVLKVRRWRI
jgi:ABC-2 type transport system permease protein